jgi:homoserine O-acetyltransferase
MFHKTPLPQFICFCSPMSTYQFHYEADFQLENGKLLPGFQLAYQTFGQLSPEKDNVLWVCHALTANSDVADWWPGMVGPGALFDTDRYFIICANMLGSCYGSTNALSLNPQTQQPYYHDFPLLTNRDIVRAFDLLRQDLAIEKIRMVIGGSLGGQQCLEWAIMQPEVFEKLVPIATNARHSPWGIAFNESQRMAIAADASWPEKHPEAGLEGMRAARSIALLSYRNYRTYWNTQLEPELGEFENYRASSYQQYQGDKLKKRFHAFAYWTLSKAMDSQNLGRGRGSIEAALGQITAETLVVGLPTDWLFPIEEQRFLQRHIPGARIAEIGSQYGHDGFLIEVEQLTDKIGQFLAN